MLYLSRLILNPRSRQVRAELINPYEMHRTLLRSVDADRQEAGLLFRVDVARATGVPTVLVQSQVEPNWGYLQEAQAYLLPAHDDNPALKPFLPRLNAGQLLQFRLRANPTMRRLDGKRVGRYREDEQREWLDRKLSLAGCRLTMCQIVKEDMVEAGKHEAGHRVKMPLLAVRFDGVLQVADPAALEQALRQGIGSAKAFGFGLLSLAPAR